MNMLASRPPTSERAAAAPHRRRFLLLQGPIGGFFSLLARRLRDGGHEVFRIHLNGGDRLFWSGDGVDYRGDRRQWPEFLRQQLQLWDISDIVLFGDCRPLHRAAIDLAGPRGVTVHVFEEGYLRPNWVTLEHGGVNDNSSLPRDAGWYREKARPLPQWQPGQAVSSSFPRRAAEDVAYNLATWLSHWRYPGYRTHKPWHPFVEYRAGARRFFSKRAERRWRDQQAEQLVAGARPYYLFPLQLEADSQIRFHSCFDGMAAAIGKVVASFAQHAPQDSLLVVTEHPLDSGVIDLRQATLRLAREHHLEARVIFMRGGSTDPLVRQARGVVTVNSTLGMLALGFGVPVKLLGRAIYDIPGLTYQYGVDRFWQDAMTPEAAPDASLFDCFRRVLVARAQINGGLYSRKALRLAADNAARRMTQGAWAPAATSLPSHAPRHAALSLDDAEAVAGAFQVSGG